MTPPRSASGAPPQGGAASGPAKPVPRRPLGRAAVLLAILPAATLAQATAAKFEPAQIEAGREQYHRTCSQCHGRNMVNAGTTVYDLRRFPVDQAERFLHSVTQGKGNMPSFKEALTPEQIAVLWAYVGSRGGKEN
jgi:mono/diheme cytochrome c family protein